MFNISFLACTKVELWDLTVCIAVNGEKFQSDLDLGPIMPNIELVRDIFIYNMFRFHVPRSIVFKLSCKNTHKHKCTQTRMHTHRDSDKYSIVVFSKNATIIMS